MKLWTKGIAILLGVLLSFSMMLSASTLSPSPPEYMLPSLEELPTVDGTTVPPSTDLPPETTIPPTAALPLETTVPLTPTLPPETTVPPTTTLPPETTVPPTTTLPPETTVPPATTSPPETTVPPTTQVPAETTVAPTLTVKNYFIYQCSDNELLAVQGKLTEILYPASITKLLTALVALKYLSPSDLITAGNILTTLPADSSKAGLAQGDTLSAEQLLYGMLLPSGGDAARVLACGAGRMIANNHRLTDAQAYDVFIAEMNDYAKSIGMTHSHFVNPDGYHDPQHYSSMQDLILLGKLCLKNSLILKICGTSSVPSPLDPSNEWKNSNLFLNEDNRYYHPYAIGLKTGNTSAAGSCLLSAFLVKGEYYLMGTFGSTDYFTRFEDALILYRTYIDP